MNIIENLCRICRKDCTNFSESILNIYEGTEIHEMMQKTCPIDINIGDPVNDLLPKVICFECLGIIASAYSLQKISIESDQYFRTILCSEILVKTEKPEVPEVTEVKEEYETVEHYEFLEEGTEETYFERDYDELSLVPRKRRRTKAAFSFNPRPVNPKYPRGMYRCNFCLVELKPRDTMTRHMYAEHDPIVYRFPCQFCVQRFTTEKKRSLHEKLRHHKKTDQREVITCKLCGATGISEEGMKHHILDDHEHADCDEVNEAQRTVFNPRPVNKADRSGYKNMDTSIAIYQ
jgi:Zinc-finger associated domain (zf-AD)